MDLSTFLSFTFNQVPDWNKPTHPDQLFFDALIELAEYVTNILLNILPKRSYNICTYEGILWTVSTLYRELSLLNRELNILPPSLPYAGIHQDLGYRHLRPTIEDESLYFKI